MDERVLLGRRIKELRKARGLSQEALAEKMDGHPKYLGVVSPPGQDTFRSEKSLCTWSQAAVARRPESLAARSSAGVLQLSA
jgi:transcriptional regulator with XRE-family HTH domain